jgi:cytochrome c-type protein NapB
MKRPVTSAVLLALLVGVAVTACQPAGAQEVALRPNRAFDGAPPVVPHPVQELGRGNCLACHLSGHAQWEGKLAPRTPHPELVRCTQCHVESGDAAPFTGTSFAGRAYVVGVRPQPEGPWLIPHPLTMREDCLACHTDHPTMPASQVTTHAERVRCTQCHLPKLIDAPGPRPGVLPGGDL